MTLKFRFVLYLLIIHFMIALFSWPILEKNRLWFFGLEAFFLVSLLTGISLIRRLFGPLNLIRSGAEMIRNSDFTIRILPTGQRDLDTLIEVYNRMIDHLREERLRTQEKQYFLEKILSTSPSGIIIFDHDKRVTWLNPGAEKIMGIEAADWIGQVLQGIPQALARELETLNLHETRILNFRGARRLKVQRLQFLDRGFPRDFILLEELTEELWRSEKAAYEKLIRMMSHEINNTIGASNSLLNSCMNYGAQLQEEDREDFEKALRVAITRTEHLNSFMRSFAEVIRLPKPDLRPCDMVQLLRDIHLLLKPDCDKQRIHWRWDIKEDPGLIPIDKNQMEQALVNILRNSLEAMGENGNLTVRLDKVRGKHFVMIEDDGSGIPPEVQKHLFTPFFTTKPKGQGIGLTLVQEILRQHRFEFSLESQPHQFTRFSVFF